MSNFQLDQFFRQYGHLVYRRALYLLGRPEDAEEATQEVFIRALKNANEFEERSGVYTWLNRITTNYCLNWLRDKSRRKQLFDRQMQSSRPAFAGEPSPEGMLTMRKLLALADPSWTQAAIYVFVDGMSHKEAAQILGVSRRTVGNLLDRFQKWAIDYLDGTG